MKVEQIIKKLSNYCDKIGITEVKNDNSWLQPAATFHIDFLNKKLIDNKIDYYWYQKCYRQDDVCLEQPSDRSAIHHQFQIVIKKPTDCFNFIFGICKVLGLNNKLVTFNVDNWNNRIIGCYGKGWEVLYKGMEIAQITFIDKINNKAVDNLTLEFAIGVERLAMLTEPSYFNYFDLYEDLENANSIKKYNDETIERIEKTPYWQYINKIKEEIINIITLSKNKLLNVNLRYQKFLVCNELFNMLHASNQIHYSIRYKLISLLSNIFSIYVL